MPSKAERRQKWNNMEENKVVLHMFNRTKTRPNGSPFCMKLETFLRMAKIDYETDVEEPLGAKGKSPWVTFNKEDLADSQFIIDHLSEKLDKDMNKNLDDRQKALARSLRCMLEDHFFWCMVTITTMQKGKYFKSISAPLPVPGFLQGFVFNQIMKGVAKQAHGQGMGRHSREDVERLGLEDLKALSDYLMNKPFLMGNEPTEVDCCAFAFLCMVYGGDPEDDSGIIKGAQEMDKLKEYFERMKEKYYPDWDEILYKEEEKKKKEDKKEKDGDKDKDKEDEDKKEEDKKEGSEEKKD